MLQAATNIPMTGMNAQTNPMAAAFAELSLGSNRFPCSPFSELYIENPVMRPVMMEEKINSDGIIVL